MSNEMMISIICPVYNKEPYIRECIETVRGQSYDNWELILVDDGSTDMCPEICDEYARADEKITVIHQKNAGHSEARNTGIKAAKGDWIMFIDADDLLYDADVLSKMVCCVQQQGLDICLSKISTMRDTVITDSTWGYFEFPYEDMTGLDVLCSMIEQNHYHATMCSRLFKLDLILKNDLFFKKLICDDEEWTPQMFYHARKIGFVDANGYVIRKLEDSVTGKKDVNTYLRKIKDKAATAVMLSEQFEQLSDISAKQRKILYSKFYSFINMAFYSYMHDLEDMDNLQIKKYLRDQYESIKKYKKYWTAKCKVQYIISKFYLTERKTDKK